MKTFQKALSIHSEDRDLLKYPNASKFAFELPVEYKNVLALRLTDISLPSLYTFSESRNNLTFSVNYTLNPSLNEIVTISPGNYTIPTMLSELNFAITGVVVQYDNVRNTFVFGSTYPDFTLSFVNYPIANYLGFQQIIYTATIGGTAVNQYQNNHITVIPGNYYIEAPYPCSFQGDPFIYMELDLYNNIDELTPYTIQNKGTSKHNLAFAKIPTRLFGVGETVYVSKELYLSNVFYSDPPLERVQKFQCKFRYHDGTLVDFGVSKFSFTIEITMLIYPNYCPWD
jgi:hypothetical protein